MDVLTLAAISSSAITVVKKVLESYKSTRLDAHFDVGTRIELPPRLDLPPAFIEALKKALAESDSPASVLTLSRQASTGEDSAKPAFTSKEVGALALALSPDSVFIDARKRISLVFKLNLGIAVALAVILLTGIAGGLYSSLFLRDPIWSSVFGGVSVADLIGVYAFKPLAAINAALVSTIRLDNLQLRLQQQLADCTQLVDVQNRIDCQAGVWEKIQIELATLGQTALSRPNVKRKTAGPK